VQDVAAAHWEAIAPLPDQSGLFWVVLRHEIDYKAPALLGDELIIETRVGELSGLAFERHVSILRKTDRKLLARARTLWCPVNAVTRHPQRVSAELRALFSTSQEH
jgi:acyl-CoA thioester hydrolase